MMTRFTWYIRPITLEEQQQRRTLTVNNMMLQHAYALQKYLTLVMAKYLTSVMAVSNLWHCDS